MTDAQKSKTERPIEESFYEGSEPIFGTFMQAQISMNGLRLTLDEKVKHSVSELASDIETTRRIFLHQGEVVSALHDLRRIENGFALKVQAWEAAVAERERNKHGKSGNEIAKMKAEVARVRISTNLTRRTLAKLKTELHQIATHDPDLEDDYVRPEKKSNINPGLQERLKTSFTARILDKFIDTGLLLGYHNAKRMIVGEFGAREEAWDLGLSVMLVVGWYPTTATHVKPDHFDLNVWLVPKSPPALSDLLRDYQEYCLLLRVAGKLPLDLKWKVVDTKSDLTPRSHSLLPFLQKIQSERFAPENQPMQLLFGSCKEPVWKNSSTELGFRII